MKPWTIADYEAAKLENRNWGPWKLRKSNYTLVLPYGDRRGDRYYIDLETCTTSAGVLDWIAQVTLKTWADDAVIAGLVRALNDILELQGTLCGGGIGKRLDVATIKRYVKGTPR